MQEIEESQCQFPNKIIVFISLKFSFALANSVDPDKMPSSSCGSSMFVKVSKGVSSQQTVKRVLSLMMRYKLSAGKI